MTSRPTRARLVIALVAVLAACAPAQPPARTAAAQSPAPTAGADLVITDVTVIDVERGRLVPGQDVLIRRGRIHAVVPSRPRASAGTDAARVIDGRGKYVLPGLWDMHAHLNLGPGRTPPELALFVAHGVTGLRIMSAERARPVTDGPTGLELHRRLQARIDSGTVVGPRLLALASWPVNGETGIDDSLPAYYKARTRDEGRQLARHLKDRGFDFIKVYNNVSREGYFGLAEEARRLGIPFAGHEPAALSALELSEAGQRSIEHSRIFLFNCFSGADSLRQGLLRHLTPTQRRRRMIDGYDPRICAELFRTFARNGTWITPTHLTRRMDAFVDDSAYRDDPRLRYIPPGQRLGWFADAAGMVAGDSSRAGRQSYRDFYTAGLALTGAAHRAGVPVMLGTDANDSFVFPGSSVHDELAELVKAGLTPAEALRAATLAGATFLGRTADFGTVQSGRVADLLLLDADPLRDIANSRRIHAVLLGGRPFARAALDSMLAEVEAAVSGVRMSRITLACCDSGRSIAYVGTKEQDAPQVSIRDAP